VLSKHLIINQEKELKQNYFDIIKEAIKEYIIYSKYDTKEKIFNKIRNKELSFRLIEYTDFPISKNNKFVYAMAVFPENIEILDIENNILIKCFDKETNKNIKFVTCAIESNEKDIKVMIKNMKKITKMGENNGNN
jgi:hypothetical protein